MEDTTQMTPPDQPDAARPPEKGSPSNPFLLPIVVLIVVAAVYWLATSGTLLPLIGPTPEAHRGVGKALSYLELRPLTGGGSPISVGDLKDHVTLINFWATWCPPCCAELPHMAEIARRFAGQEAFRLLAVSTGSRSDADGVPSLREDTAALLKRLKLDVPTYYDPDDRTQAALDKLIVFEGYPTTVLLDRRGVVRAVWVGYWSGAETEMERHIDALLEEKSGR